MEKLRARVEAAERATREAKQALDKVRDDRSRASAKLDDYEERLRTMRRGREHDSLRRKYDALQCRLTDIRAEVHRALDAHAELSKESLDLLDQMVEAEDLARSNRNRARYAEAEPPRRDSAPRHTYTRTTYPYPSPNRDSSASSQESNHGPRHGRSRSFEEFTRHRHERSRQQASSRGRHGRQENYTTEEHVPRSHRGHRDNTPDSTDDEADFSSDDHRSFHPGYSPSPPRRGEQDFHPGYTRPGRGEQEYTTEEHVPRSERSKRDDSHDTRRQQSSRTHRPEPEYHHRNQRGPRSHYTTEEHRPHPDGPREGPRRTSRDEEQGHRSSRSTPRPQQSQRGGTPQDHPRHSDPARDQPDAPQPTRLPSQQTIDSWWKYVNHCFEDYSKITQFPIPPALSCGRPDCDATSSSRPIAACECNIRASFGMVPSLNIKRERLRWHPDKFTACPANLREGFQKMASEIFIVLDKMHKEN